MSAVEILHPGSREEWLELRQHSIGASEIAALAGAPSYPGMTPYYLWAKKSGLLGPEDETGPMRRGRYVERLAVDFLREERPDWVIEQNAVPGGKFYVDHDTGQSATPDIFANDPKREGIGVIQIKSVGQWAFKEGWHQDGEIKIPTWVAIQNIQEMVLSGASWAAVAPCVIGDAGILLPVIEVELHAGIMGVLRAKAREFWRRVRENDPYSPDFAADGELINQLFAEDDGGTVDLSGNERVLDHLRRREVLAACEATGRAAEAERKVIDAELKFALGNAVRGTLADGRVIECKTVRRRGFTVEPTTFRPLKVKYP